MPLSRGGGALRDRAGNTAEKEAAQMLHRTFVPLYSALGRAHLQCCLQLWGPQHKKDTKLLEWSPVEAMRMLRGLELCSGERVRELCLFSLEKSPGSPVPKGCLRQLERDFGQGYGVTGQEGMVSH